MRQRERDKNTNILLAIFEAFGGWGALIASHHLHEFIEINSSRSISVLKIVDVN